MPVPCRMAEPFPGWDAVQPGDMWHYGRDEWLAGKAALEARFRDLAPEYFRDNFAQRPPLIVMLPNGDPFRIDTKASVSGDGWAVSGVPPLITVSPSIHLVGYYHGWLTAGVLSDDPAMVVTRGPKA